MNAEEKISEIVKNPKKDPILSVAADVLRALVVLQGSAWQSDLLEVLNDLWYLEDTELDSRSGEDEYLSDALRRLNEADLVQSEKRQRADLGTPKPSLEELHTAKNLQILVKMFAADRLVNKYREENRHPS